VSEFNWKRLPLVRQALLHHAPEISANDGKGSELVLRQHGRTIIFTVFLPMSWFLLLLNDSSDLHKHGLPMPSTV
jgi:hypothetical protein